MTTRKRVNKNIRNLTRVGGTSLAVTIPAEYVAELGWRERQKVVVKKKGRSLLISDWKS